MEISGYSEFLSHRSGAYRGGNEGDSNNPKEHAMNELLAYYTQGSKTKSPILSLMRGRETVEVVEVSGKREARKRATARGAKCWNF